MADMNNIQDQEVQNTQNDFFSADAQETAVVPDSEKKPHTTSIVLGIVGIIGGLLIPLIGFGCGAGAIVTANKNAAVAKTGAGRILGILAIVVSAINMILGIIINLQRMGITN
ncbi:MAG: hypothetical protein J6I96_03110 [Oscillospiraceae bacterium]|nr:hypothetical protein [Oscillospiraceae bacterium]